MPEAHRYTLYLPDRQVEAFGALKVQTGLTVSELMRRCLDYGLRPAVLNEIVPMMSGQLSINGGR